MLYILLDLRRDIGQSNVALPLLVQAYSTVGTPDYVASEVFKQRPTLPSVTTSLSESSCTRCSWVSGLVMCWSCDMGSLVLIHLLPFSPTQLHSVGVVICLWTLEMFSWWSRSSHVGVGTAFTRPGGGGAINLVLVSRI